MTVLLVSTGEVGDDVERVARALRSAGAQHVVPVSERALYVVLTEFAGSLATVVLVAGDDADGAHRACRAVRDVSAVPMAMVSSSRREVDELMAFSGGCDDYISASCSTEVLTARLTSLITRGRSRNAGSTVFGCLRLDPMLRTATVRAQPVSLTPIEFDLAELLVSNQSRVVPRREIVERVWGGAHIPEHVLDVHLSRLRRKVLAAGGPHLGQPVRSVGYRVGSVTCAPAECDPGEARLCERVDGLAGGEGARSSA